MHRRIRKSHVARESFFRFLFLLLLFLSILRTIDLMPSPENRSLPVFSDATPVPEHEEEQVVPAEPSQPEPLTITSVKTAILSRGMDLRGQAPRILIYHTHTTEAYTATKSSPYVKTTSYRTADAGKSVLAVGEALAERLRTQYGFAVLHDTTDHEPPSLKTAYTRSEATMRRYLEQYPSLVLFIDIHRDASSDTSDYVLVDGCPTARLMCVVGQGTNYAQKPDFDKNYALASALTDHLRCIEKRLARDVRVKSGRYNQHVGQLSLLIEVGHNANTLEQVLHAVPSLAECLALTLAELEDDEPVPGEEALFQLPLIPQQPGIDKG